MQCPNPRLTTILCCAAALLCACGGGGSGAASGALAAAPGAMAPPAVTSPQPGQPAPAAVAGTSIVANVYLYADGYPATDSFFSGPPAGLNAMASVYVGDSMRGGAVMDAEVVVDGRRLVFDSETQVYRGALSADLGAMVSLSVRVGSQVFTATTRQLASLPVVTSPAATHAVPAGQALTVAWSAPTRAASSTSTSEFAYSLWIGDVTSGRLTWMSWESEVDDVLGPTYAIPARALTAGPHLLGLSAADCRPIAGTVGTSALCAGVVRTVSIAAIQ
ncbi:hypothetical protein [Pelomonas sp. SE-A7]|uniref:hypothetical protein n=1 Tax=Pelomonas sp. SE-A7 TaxID=3054953 RepID=UPI00259CCB4E|nr:hypothetical protein [Pelomonas sp. SE-A7]MDM4766617.1 hypothetical protein [Pelomonas sp. SE-A7]